VPCLNLDEMPGNLQMPRNRLCPLTIDRRVTDEDIGHNQGRSRVCGGNVTSPVREMHLMICGCHSWRTLRIAGIRRRRIHRRPASSKEDLVRELIRREGLTEGVVCRIQSPGTELIRGSKAKPLRDCCIVRKRQRSDGSLVV
jgi:hypothetical protein